jgi:hypothetical protein
MTIVWYPFLNAVALMRGASDRPSELKSVECSEAEVLILQRPI